MAWSDVLTERQARIASMVARGLSNNQIADVLSYSESTIKSEVVSACRATATINRVDLAVWWVKMIETEWPLPYEWEPERVEALL